MQQRQHKNIISELKKFTKGPACVDWQCRCSLNVEFWEKIPPVFGSQGVSVTACRKKNSKIRKIAFKVYKILNLWT